MLSVFSRGSNQLEVESIADSAPVAKQHIILLLMHGKILHQGPLSCHPPATSWRCVARAVDPTSLVPCPSHTQQASRHALTEVPEQKAGLNFFSAGV